MAGNPETTQRAGVLNLYEEEALALIALAMVGATHPGGTDTKARLVWTLGCRAVEKAMAALAMGSPEFVRPHLDAWHEWRLTWRARCIQEGVIFSSTTPHGEPILDALRFRTVCEGCGWRPPKSAPAWDRELEWRVQDNRLLCTVCRARKQAAAPAREEPR